MVCDPVMRLLEAAQLGPFRRKPRRREKKRAVS
jgi:hypothetical protein